MNEPIDRPAIFKDITIVHVPNAGYRVEPGSEVSFRDVTMVDAPPNS